MQETLRRGKLVRFQPYPPNAPLAQLDRAFGYEPKGQRFESSKVYQAERGNVRFGKQPVMRLLSESI